MNLRPANQSGEPTTPFAGAEQRRPHEGTIYDIPAGPLDHLWDEPTYDVSLKTANETGDEATKHAGGKS